MKKIVASFMTLAFLTVCAGVTFAGDAAKGKKVYKKKCKQCHNLTDKKKVGPGFKGIYGSESTTKGMEGYKLDDAGIKAWIENPKKIFPKSKMAKMFKKKLSDDEIEDVIEFLKTVK